MRKDYTPAAFIVIGCIFLVQAAFFLVIGIIGEAVLSQTYMMLAMMIMAFSMSYLYPQFKQKDERMKYIRYKALTYSAVAFVIYYIILTGIIQFDIITVTAIEALNILGALMISTVFIIMVILAKCS